MTNNVQTTKKQHMITLQMVKFEMLNVIGNPYIHIFGVGLPIVLALLITKVAESEIKYEAMLPEVATSIYLGMGTLIPMATILMGYGVSYAQELSKGIPQRMQLFGIKSSVTLCNRVIAQMFFLLFAFLLFFLSGYIFSEIEQPTAAGFGCYILCILLFSIICFALAHGIASLLQNFGQTYCVSMILYFAFMILGGMMGISYDDLPKWAQLIAKMLPVMYINKDFYQIWTGKAYEFMPLIQSFLFLGAVSGILLFFTCKRSVRNCT